MYRGDRSGVCALRRCRSDTVTSAGLPDGFATCADQRLCLRAHDHARGGAGFAGLERGDSGSRTVAPDHGAPTLTVTAGSWFRPARSPIADEQPTSSSPGRTTA